MDASPRPSPLVVETATGLLKALANPMRLRIVLALAASDRCVHELVDELGAPQPLVSQHLRLLRAARLIAGTRRGREVVYALADAHVAQIARDAVDHAGEIGAGSGRRSA